MDERASRTAAVLLLTCVIACHTGGAASWCAWTDNADDPLIRPPAGGIGVIADPTFLPPSESPDGSWHLFAAAPTLGLYHATSADGVHWDLPAQPEFPGLLLLRPYIYPEAGTYYLLYESYPGLSESQIEMVTSTDLAHWTQPVTLLTPTLAWEQVSDPRTGNPFLMKREGQYWLYYSAGDVVLPDWTSDTEPRYIGLARAPAITGPYTKETQPLISPSSTDPYRNLGAGSMKLLPEEQQGQWIAFNNGIYLDAAGHSHSAIRLLSSSDGLTWDATLCSSRPIIAPEGTGWKSAFVYGFDGRFVGDTLWLYYNGRDGWADGIEQIGLSTAVPP